MWWQEKKSGGSEAILIFLTRYIFNSLTIIPQRTRDERWQRLIQNAETCWRKQNYHLLHAGQKNSLNSPKGS